MYTKVKVLKLPNYNAYIGTKKLLVNNLNEALLLKPDGVDEFLTEHYSKLLKSKFRALEIKTLYVELEKKEEDDE